MTSHGKTGKRPKQPGHTPIWPQFIPEPKERTLALMLGDRRWVTEHGETATPQTWGELTAQLFAWNALAFCGAIEVALAPWWDELMAEDEAGAKGANGRGQWCELHVNPTSHTLVSLSIHKLAPGKGGRRRWQVRHIVSLAAWGLNVEPGVLTLLRSLFELVGAGTESTPGALGSATMKGLWKKHEGEHYPRHHRPARDCVDALAAHAVGSRKETYCPDQVFTQAYELDATNGFAAQVDILPAGTVEFLREATRYLLPMEQPAVRCFAWWGRCYVRVWRDLPLGDKAPFCIRDEDGQLDWQTPTKAGGYWAYLWSFEAEETQKRFAEDGCMEILGIEWAYLWPTNTPQLAEWAEDMDAKRREALRIGGKPLADLVKMSIVAGIGRLGVDYSSSRVVTEPQDGDELVTSEKVPGLELWLRREDADPGTPKHWHSYVLSRMNLDIYHQMRRQYLAGKQVVACNVDGIWLAERPVGGIDPAVAEVKMGEYKVRDRGWYLAAPVPGEILTPDKVATPGRRDGGLVRQRLARLGEEAQRTPGERHHRGARGEARETWSRAMRAQLSKPEQQIYEQLERLRTFHRERVANGWDHQYVPGMYTAWQRQLRRQIEWQNKHSGPTGTTDDDMKT